MDINKLKKQEENEKAKGTAKPVKDDGSDNYDDDEF